MLGIRKFSLKAIGSKPNLLGVYFIKKVENYSIKKRKNRLLLQKPSLHSPVMLMNETHIPGDGNRADCVQL